MEKMLAGKVALVTGGSRGIGKAIAMLFASQGAAVAFTYQSAQAGKQTEAELKQVTDKVKGYQADATLYEVAKDVVDDVVKTFGRIDVLVNNAGITRDGLLMRMTAQQWDDVMTGNLKSVFNYCQVCSTYMMRQRSGSIINMSSVVGVHGNAGQCNYSASKAGMIGLAKSIAQELGSRGVRANAIAPGFIITDMTNQLSEEVKAEWAKRIPLRRGGTPEDVANIATFLASDMSSYVTGQVIQVDGGMNM